MSFGIPLSYAELQNNLAIPSQLVGDDLKNFSKGARSNVRSVPTSSGNIGAAASILFNLPTGGYDYIKDNSMYLKCDVTINSTHAANTNPSSLYFSGQSNAAAFHIGGASSLINRVNVLVGGTSLSYPNYNTFRNSVLPHIVGSQFISNDLRQLEYAGVALVGNASSGGGVANTISVAIPLFLPPFCSNQAFPALLMSTPITIEILTESVKNAFYSIECEVDSYTISSASLVYETITVSSEFKQALLQSKAGQMYNIKLNDWMSVGPTASQNPLIYQIGCGLSSLRSVLWTYQLSDDLTATKDKPKKYVSNGLADYKVHVNNLQISVNQPDNDAVAYAEVNRALSKINDYNITSALNVDTNTNTSGLRNTYTTYNFLAGASCDIFSDYGYHETGIPASTVTLELNNTGATARKWQTAASHSAASVYIYMMHDSLLSVDVSSGVVMVRK